MGKLRRRAKGSSSALGAENSPEAKKRQGRRQQQRRYTGLPRLNRAQLTFKRKQKRAEHQKNESADSKEDQQKQTQQRQVGSGDGEQQRMMTPPDSSNLKPNINYGHDVAAQSDEGGSSDNNKQPPPPPQQQKQRPYLSAYKRAQLTYERLQSEKRAQWEKERAERERLKAEQDFNLQWRKKKNQALQLRTQKGQPNLNAQIGVLLEKIGRKTKDDDE